MMPALMKNAGIPLFQSTHVCHQSRTRMTNKAERPPQRSALFGDVQPIRTRRIKQVPIKNNGLVLYFASRAALLPTCNDRIVCAAATPDRKTNLVLRI